MTLGRDRIVLALDLGATTGYAYTATGEIDLERVGHWDLRHQRHGREPLLRASDAGETLAKLPHRLEEIRPDTVIYEIARGRRGISAAQNYGARLGSVFLWTYERRAEVVGIHSATLKLYATGYGAASKDQMMDAARMRLGWNGELDDEADALWLLHAYLAGVK